MLKKRLDGKRREAWHEWAGAQCSKTKVIGQWGGGVEQQGWEDEDVLQPRFEDEAVQV